MKKTLVIFSVLYVFFNTFTKVTSLQCYECSNCTEVQADYLVTCGGSTSTSSSSSTTTTTTTTTVAPSNGTSTQAPGNGTTTEAPGNDTTTEAPGNGTDIQPPNNSTNGNSTSYDYEATRVKRNIEENNNCICENGYCDCSGLYVLEARANTTYVCVKDTLQVNGVTVVNRGCAVKYSLNNATCLNASFNASCSVCDTDKCNGSTSLEFSAFVMLLSLVSYIYIL